MSPGTVYVATGPSAGGCLKRSLGGAQWAALPGQRSPGSAPRAALTGQRSPGSAPWPPPVLSLHLEHLSWADLPALGDIDGLGRALAADMCALLPPADTRSAREATREAASEIAQHLRQFVLQVEGQVEGHSVLRIAITDTLNQRLSLALIVALCEQAGPRSREYQRLAIPTPTGGLGAMAPHPSLAAASTVAGSAWQPISAQEIALCQHLWRAARDPELLQAWLAEPQPHWSALAYRARCPAPGTLSPLDRQIQAALAPGPMALRPLIQTLLAAADPKDPHPPGQLLLRLRRLCHGPEPLLTTTGPIRYDTQPLLAGAATPRE